MRLEAMGAPDAAYGRGTGPTPNLLGHAAAAPVARGDATVDSDYDLMIVVENHAAPNQCRPDLAYRAVRGLERSGDFLVWTREAFQQRLHIKSSLPATVPREGKLLYASA